jgi:uncharacterized Rmd1/YagE family protein
MFAIKSNCLKNYKKILYEKELPSQKIDQEEFKFHTVQSTLQGANRIFRALKLTMVIMKKMDFFERMQLAMGPIWS